MIDTARKTDPRATDPRATDPRATDPRAIGPVATGSLASAPPALDARMLAAGALGGIVAGVALSVLFLAMERTSGKPSDIVRLGRKTANAMGSPYMHQETTPALDEQVRYHGGHLVLSAAMGAAYPVARSLPGFGKRSLGGIGGGLLFGAALYPLFWGLLGPKLGLTPTPRQEGIATVSQRIGVHAVFGMVTALVANAFKSRKG